MRPLTLVAPEFVIRSSVRLSRDYYVRGFSNDYSLDAGTIGRIVDVEADWGKGDSEHRRPAACQPRTDVGQTSDHHRSRASGQSRIPLTDPPQRQGRTVHGCWLTNPLPRQDAVVTHHLRSGYCLYGSRDRAGVILDGVNEPGFVRDVVDVFRRDVDGCRTVLSFWASSFCGQKNWPMYESTGRSPKLFLGARTLSPPKTTGPGMRA